MRAPVLSLDPYNPFGIDTRDPAEYQAALGQFRFEKLRRQIRLSVDKRGLFPPALPRGGRRLAGQHRTASTTFATSPLSWTKRAIASLRRRLACALRPSLRPASDGAARRGNPSRRHRRHHGRPDLLCLHPSRPRRVASRAFADFAEAGIRLGETTFHAFGLSLWLAGLTYVQALEAYGARPVAVGAEAGVAENTALHRIHAPEHAVRDALNGKSTDRARAGGNRQAGRCARHQACAVRRRAGAGLPAFRERVRAEFGAEVFRFHGRRLAQRRAVLREPRLPRHALSHRRHLLSLQPRRPRDQGPAAIDRRGRWRSVAHRPRI